MRANFHHQHSLDHPVSSGDSYIRIRVDGEKEEVVVMVYDVDAASDSTVVGIVVDTGVGDGGAAAAITSQKFCSYYHNHHQSSCTHCSSCCDAENIVVADTGDVLVVSRSVNVVRVLWC